MNANDVPEEVVDRIAKRILALTSESSKERAGKAAIEPNAAYTVQEAAALLSVSEKTIRKLSRCGYVRASRVFGGWRVRGGELLRHLPGPRNGQ